MPPREAADAHQLADGLFAGHTQVGEVVRLAAGHHEIERVDAAGGRPFGAPQVRDQRRADHTRPAGDAGRHLGRVATSLI